MSEINNSKHQHSGVSLFQGLTRVVDLIFLKYKPSTAYCLKNYHRKQLSINSAPLAQQFIINNIPSFIHLQEYIDFKSSKGVSPENRTTKQTDNCFNSRDQHKW